MLDRKKVWRGSPPPLVKKLLPLVKKLPSEQKNNNTAAPTATELAALPRRHPSTGGAALRAVASLRPH